MIATMGDTTSTTTTMTTTNTPAASTLQPVASNTSPDTPHTESTVATGFATEAPPPSSTPGDALPSVPTNDTPILPQRPRESPVDPQVVALRAMFPDYDDLILQSVLESVGGNQDHAIDVLLGMSDPDYRSEQPPPAPAPVSQTDLDEQLARRLMLEEQEAQQVAWQAQETQRVQRYPSSRPHLNQQTASHDQNTGAPSSGDTMGEFQQQFSKIAETGKKTFGTIFSKVKAKIQEFDQPKPGQGSNPSNQSAWGGSSTYDPYQSQQAPQGQQQPYLARPPSHQVPQPHQQQPAYYDPNEYSQRSTSPSPPITVPSTRPAPSGLQGYDAAPDAPTQPGNASSPVTAPVPSTITMNAVSTPPTTEVLHPPQTGSSIVQAGTPIDGGKLGLLPKRPVSLLRSQSPPAAGGTTSPQQMQRSASEDDSDGLEYAENPFEERKK